MPLVATFFACLVGLTAVFLGVSLTLQRVFYNQPADKLPLRALVAALMMAIFLTGWAFLNTRASHKDKYGTLFEFSSTAQSTVDEFQAVRRLRFKENNQYKEETVPHVWRTNGSPTGGEFVEKGTLKPFSRSSSDYVTAALVVPRDGKPVRFAAPLDELKYAGLTKEQPNVTFKDESSLAFLSDQNLHVMETPSASGLVLVLFLNVLHFALWLVAFWPILRFRVGLALVLVTLFGGVTMFILMPLLFNANAVKAPPIVRTA